MLNREHVVVAEHAKGRDKFTPPSGVMPISHCAEDPRAVAFIGVFLRIEYTGHGKVSIVDLSILGVHVENSIAQYSNRRDWIDTLPEHVTGIIVHTDGFACCRAQAKPSV